MTKQDLWTQVYLESLKKDFSTVKAETAATQAVKSFEKAFGNRITKEDIFDEEILSNTWPSDGIGSKCLNCGHEVKHGQEPIEWTMPDFKGNEYPVLNDDKIDKDKLITEFPTDQQQLARFLTDAGCDIYEGEMIITWYLRGIDKVIDFHFDESGEGTSIILP